MAVPGHFVFWVGHELYRYGYRVWICSIGSFLSWKALVEVLGSQAEVCVRLGSD